MLRKLAYIRVSVLSLITTALRLLSNCSDIVIDVGECDWMSANHLKLNMDKIELLRVESRLGPLSL